MKKGFLKKKPSSKAKRGSGSTGGKIGRSNARRAAAPATARTAVSDDDDDELPPLLPDMDAMSADEDEINASGLHHQGRAQGHHLRTNKSSASSSSAEAKGSAQQGCFDVELKYKDHMSVVRAVTKSTTFGTIRKALMRPETCYGELQLPRHARPESIRLGFHKKKKHPDSMAIGTAGISALDRRIIVSIRQAKSSKQKVASTSLFSVLQPAEVEDAGGVWHPCRILAVDSAGLRCVSQSLSTIDPATVYNVRHFRPSTFQEHQPAEVWEKGQWHPCSIHKVDRVGVLISSLSLAYAHPQYTDEFILFQADRLRFPTFVPNQPAEVEAGGFWHPCRILAVEPNGFRCASGSLPSIRENTPYKARHFRFSTFRPDEAAEVEAGGVWHPCRILSVEINGIRCSSNSLTTIDENTVYNAHHFRFSTTATAQWPGRQITIFLRGVSEDPPEPVHLDVEVNCTIGTIKRQVYARKAALLPADVAPGRLRLFFQNLELTDNDRTLLNYLLWDAQVLSHPFILEVPATSSEEPSSAAVDNVPSTTVNSETSSLPSKDEVTIGKVLEGDLMKQRVSTLKTMMQARGLSMVGLLEKRDIVRRLVQEATAEAAAGRHNNDANADATNSGSVDGAPALVAKSTADVPVTTDGSKDPRVHCPDDESNSNDDYDYDDDDGVPDLVHFDGRSSRAVQQFPRNSEDQSDVWRMEEEARRFVVEAERKTTAEKQAEKQARSSQSSQGPVQEHMDKNRLAQVAARTQNADKAKLKALRRKKRDEAKKAKAAAARTRKEEAAKHAAEKREAEERKVAEAQAAKKQAEEERRAAMRKAEEAERARREAQLKDPVYQAKLKQEQEEKARAKAEAEAAAKKRKEADAARRLAEAKAAEEKSRARREAAAKAAEERAAEKAARKKAVKAAKAAKVREVQRQAEKKAAAKKAAAAAKAEAKAQRQAEKRDQQAAKVARRAERKGRKEEEARIAARTLVGQCVDEWYYLDAEGSVQGPFTSFRMLKWNRRGCFKPGLAVRYGPAGLLPFVRLDAVFTDGGTAFRSVPLNWPTEPAVIVKPRSYSDADEAGPKANVSPGVKVKVRRSVYDHSAGSKKPLSSTLVLDRVSLRDDDPSPKVAVPRIPDPEQTGYETLTSDDEEAASDEISYDDDMDADTEVEAPVIAPDMARSTPFPTDADPLPLFLNFGSCIRRLLVSLPLSKERVLRALQFADFPERRFLASKFDDVELSWLDDESDRVAVTMSQDFEEALEFFEYINTAPMFLVELRGSAAQGSLGNKSKASFGHSPGTPAALTRAVVDGAEIDIAELDRFGGMKLVDESMSKSASFWFDLTSHPGKSPRRVWRRVDLPSHNASWRRRDESQSVDVFGRSAGVLHFGLVRTQAPLLLQRQHRSMGGKHLRGKEIVVPEKLHGSLTASYLQCLPTTVEVLVVQNQAEPDTQDPPTAADFARFPSLRDLEVRGCAASFCKFLLNEGLAHCSALRSIALIDSAVASRHLWVLPQSLERLRIIRCPFVSNLPVGIFERLLPALQVVETEAENVDTEVQNQCASIQFQFDVSSRTGQSIWPAKTAHKHGNTSSNRTAVTAQPLPRRVVLPVGAGPTAVRDAEDSMPYEKSLRDYPSSESRAPFQNDAPDVERRNAGVAYVNGRSLHEVAGPSTRQQLYGTQPDDAEAMLGNGGDHRTLFERGGSVFAHTAAFDDVEPPADLDDKVAYPALGAVSQRYSSEKRSDSPPLGRLAGSDSSRQGQSLDRYELGYQTYQQGAQSKDRTHFDPSAVSADEMSEDSELAKEIADVEADAAAAANLNNDDTFGPSSANVNDDPHPDGEFGEFSRDLRAIAQQASTFGQETTSGDNRATFGLAGRNASRERSIDDPVFGLLPQNFAHSPSNLPTHAQADGQHDSLFDDHFEHSTASDDGSRMQLLPAGMGEDLGTAPSASSGLMSGSFSSSRAGHQSASNSDSASGAFQSAFATNAFGGLGGFPNLSAASWGEKPLLASPPNSSEGRTGGGSFGSLGLELLPPRQDRDHSGESLAGLDGQRVSSNRSISPVFSAAPGSLAGNIGGNHNNSERSGWDYFGAPHEQKQPHAPHTGDMNHLEIESGLRSMLGLSLRDGSSPSEPQAHEAFHPGRTDPVPPESSWQ